jgi:hypothetical protein
MAKFRLTAPHWLEFGPQRIPQYREAGTEISTDEMPAWFVPSPLMTPLDPDAEAMLRQVLDQIRAANPGQTGSVPVIGSMARLPGGDIWEAEQKALKAQERP